MESRPAPPRAEEAAAAAAGWAGGTGGLDVGTNGLNALAFKDPARGFGLNSWISEIETSNKLVVSSLDVSLSMVSHIVVFDCESKFYSESPHISDAGATT